MTKPPAMPELLREIVAYCREAGHDWSSLNEAEHMLAALSSQQSTQGDTPSPELAHHIQQPYTLAELNERIASNEYSAELLLQHAMLLLNAQPSPELAGVSDACTAPTIEAAREMGAKGGPVVEAERLAFEAWMAGHCWKVSPTWNGQTYDDSEEDKNRGLLDPLARTTRMLWAAWRDRAALRPAQQAPEWDGGEPANLQAAARDADEWLALIQRLNDAGRWRFSQPDSRSKLDGCRAALSKIMCATAQQAVPMTCTWAEDDETGNYATTCGHVFALNDGGPADNGMKFCCYCGGGITAQGAQGEQA